MHALIRATLVAVLTAPGAAMAQSQLRNSAGSVGLPMLRGGDPAQFLDKAAKQIDHLVSIDWMKTNTRPVEAASEDVWVRRTYLSLIGRIPTFKEFKAFREDKDPAKRAKLIDTLLSSEGYKSHTFNYWADLLRATDDWAEGIDGRPYQMWIRDAIARNKPYNEFVTELLTSSGGMWEPGNGAVGYYVRDRGMPLDNMANTTRIFLGTQIACAQCHDHPYDDWKRKDFLEMAAFTHGLKTSLHGGDYYSKVRATEGDRLKDNRDLENFDRFVRYAFFDSHVRDETVGMIEVPKDYQYRDAKPGEMIGARTMMGKSVRNLGRKPMKESRNRFAEWVTGADNPTFTKVIANRMWKRVMGAGLVEPLDDFKKNTVASNPALLDFLGNLMVEVKYDLKEFQRILYNTRTYALGTAPGEVPEGTRWNFSGRPLRRMTAEQVWDSLLALSIEDLDSRKGSQWNNYVYYGGKPVLQGYKTMADLQREFATLPADRYWTHLESLLKDIRSGRTGDKADYGGDMMMMSGRSSHGGMLRASELGSPAPASHFLRKFGQSDRITIDGASTDSDVTQALSLLNGHAERHIVNNAGSLIREFLRRCGTPEQKVNMIYYSVLNRVPTDAERAHLKAEFERDPSAAELTCLSAVLNSVEFIYIQ
jgi:hypothetical protein